MEKSIDDHETTFPIMVGPSCAALYFAGQFVDNYKFVQVSDGTPIAAVAFFRQIYHSTFIFTPLVESLYLAVPNFIKSQGWQRVFLLSETYSFWQPFEMVLQMKMAALNISLAGTSKIFHYKGFNPDRQSFKNAIDELANLDNPRVIIINTSWGATVACHLYQAGLYGPKYVFLWSYIAQFNFNSLYKTENCTNKMMQEIMKSAVIFFFATPLSLNLNVTDDVGMSPKMYLERLETAIGGSPRERIDNWLLWQSYYYNEIVGLGLVLEKLQKRLKSTRNESLMNWFGKSDNFYKKSLHYSKYYKRRVG